MAVATETTTLFEQIFRSPTTEKMLALTWGEFEDFVQYVFESAGYAVQKVAAKPKHSVDLLLYASHAHLQMGQKVVARIEVRRYKTANIIKARVQQFHGAVIEAGNAPGYLITTSDFTTPAYAAAAAANGKVRLINGQRLLRYIRYVYGSRLTGDDSQPGIPQPRIAPDYIIEAESIPRLDPLKTTVLAVANNKGGVAKTTTALNLAFALAEKKHHRVLLIDLDGQASLTQGLLGKPLPPLTLLNHFTHKTPLVDLVQATQFERIWLIPTAQQLFRLEIAGERRPAYELDFARAIHSPTLLGPDGLPFDWIIFDTSPAQTFFTRAALGSSHHVLVPITAEMQAVWGATIAFETIETMRALMNTGVNVLYGIITRWKQRVPADGARTGIQDLLRSKDVPLFFPFIPEDGQVERSFLKIFTRQHRNLFNLARPRNSAAAAYEKLMQEVLNHARRA